MSIATKSYVKHQPPGAITHVSSQAAKSYIDYPSPLSPRAVSNWRVADLCAAYNLPKGTCVGGGVIGILELGGGWTQSDLDKFSANNALPKIVVTNVPVGSANRPGGEADAEVLLDIEVAAAVYHYATGNMPTIKVFWASNTFQSFEAVVKAAVAEGCDVLSISWGSDESRWQQSAPGAAASLETVVAQAAAQGLIVFAASGDNSSGDNDPGANVDMPSSCPHIIGCGGTRKFPGAEERVWGTSNPDGEGTGGGFSNLFSMPQWQRDNSAPTGAPLNPEGGRMVPDVAGDADPETGYLVVINGRETPVGGTSAVAPFYSGLFAAFGRKLGFVGQTLWQNEAAFTDIVSGTNGQFSAGPGPDPCSGLGVPIGTALAAVFSAGDNAVQSNGHGGASRLSYGSNAPPQVAAVQAQVHNNGVGAPHISGSSYTGFALWHGNGQVRFTINDPNITADSRVFVAISEYATDARLNRFVGNAQMTVSNIAPTNGAVVIWANVNWPSALNVRFDYFVDPQQI